MNRSYRILILATVITVAFPLGALAVQYDTPAAHEEMDSDTLTKQLWRISNQELQKGLAAGDEEALGVVNYLEAKAAAIRQQEQQAPTLQITRDPIIEHAGQPEAAPSAPVGLHGDERKDNRAVMPSSGPKVVRRMPRRIR